MARASPHKRLSGINMLFRRNAKRPQPDSDEPKTPQSATSPSSGSNGNNSGATTNAATALPAELLLIIFRLALSDCLFSGAKPRFMAPNSSVYGLAYPSGPSVVNLSLVCKAWSAAAMSILYAHVFLRSSSTLHQFVDSIEHHPELRPLVRSFLFRMSNADRKLANSVSHIADVNDTLVRRALILCPSIRAMHLELHDPWLHNPWTSKDWTDALSANLTTLHLMSGDTPATMACCSKLKLPALTTLIISDFIIGSASASPSAELIGETDEDGIGSDSEKERIQEWPYMPKLQHLRLERCAQGSLCAFPDALQVPNLRRLELIDCRRSPSQIRSIACPWPVIDSLTLVDGFHTLLFTDMSSFDAVRELTLSIPFKRKLVQSFPRTLECLSLNLTQSAPYYYYNVDIFDVSGHLSTIVRRKDALFPGLKKIVVHATNDWAFVLQSVLEMDAIEGVDIEIEFIDTIEGVTPAKSMDMPVAGTMEMSGRALGRGLSHHGHFLKGTKPRRDAFKRSITYSTLGITAGIL